MNSVRRTAGYRFAVIAALALVVGSCLDVDGAAKDFCIARSDVCHADGGSDGGLDDDGGAEADAGASTTIRVTRMNRYWVGNQIVESVPDDWLAGVAAFVDVDGDGGFVELPVVVDAGLVTFTLPRGSSSYYFRDGTVWSLTDAGALDLTREIRGPRNPQAVSGTGPVRLNVSVNGLEPWSPTDQLLLFSDTRPEQGFLSPVGQLPDAATDVPDASFDFVSSYGRARVLDARDGGDAALLLQLSTRLTDGGLAYRALTRFSEPPIVISDVSGNPHVDATFVDAGAQSVTINLRVSEYVAAREQIYPGATFGYLSIQAAAFPGGLSSGAVGEQTAELPLVLAQFTSTLPDGPTTYVYGAYPKPHAERFFMGISFRLPIFVPGTTSSGVLVPSSRFELTTTLINNGLGMRVPPPTDLTVDGNNGASANTLASIAPRLCWRPQGTSRVDGYQVQFLRLSRSSVSPTETEATSIGVMRTSATCIRVPPGVISGSGTYAVIVQAIQRTPAFVDSAPYRPSISFDLTSAVIGPLVVP